MQFLSRYFFQFAVVVTFCAVSILVWDMMKLRTEILRASALQNAAAYVQALESFRTLYTSEVVDRVHSKGIKVTHDYTTHKTGAIPLPATLSMKLGQHIGASGMGIKARLYSKYPFPWHASEQLDLFEQASLQALFQNSDKPFYRFEIADDKAILRYAKADHMRAPCVQCHNSHPDSPKTDWKVGDVRGALAVTIPLENNYLSSITLIRERILMLFFLGGVFLVLLYLAKYWVQPKDDGYSDPS